jgi:hypothetical protein
MLKLRYVHLFVFILTDVVSESSVIGGLSFNDCLKVCPIILAK